MSASGPTLYPGQFPSWAVFQFPPDSAPAPLPPPYDGEWTFQNPFAIPVDIYQGALSYKVPLTIASVYAVVVTFFNWYNRQHGNKAWRIAKTRPFFAFVIAHNVFLAVYSAVTFVAMFRGLKRSFPNHSEPNALIGTVDALCKIHGPRGLGDAVTYHPDAHDWGSRNANITLGAEGLPDSTDLGRLWNEGLAFWGWWFYLSKFYEVLDTFIILAKGKRSTTLQKYHHAGAMLSMWAGMRFMSPPIWMFVLVNSGIHAMMYTYYTLAALGFRVPNIVKRTLTTMQIMQFLVGSAYAAIHLFVSYTIPVAIAYQVVEKVMTPVTTSITSTVTSIATSTAEVAPVATVPALHFLRKLIYRAAGDEGLAENIPVPGAIVPVQRGHYAPPHPEHPIQHVFHRQEHRNRTVYRTEYQHVPCIDTSGQAFAIYVNLIYLAPLTGLFMRFFVKSYLRRTSANNAKTSKHPHTKAARDAANGVEREFESLVDEAPDGVTTGADKSKDSVRGRKPISNGTTKDARSSFSPDNQDFVKSVRKKVSQRLQELDNGAESVSNKAKDVVNNLANKAQGTKEAAEQQWEQSGKTVQDMKVKVEQGLEEGQKKAGEIKNEVEEQAQPLEEQAEEQFDNVAQKATEIKDQIAANGQSVKEETGKQAQNMKEAASKQAQNAKDGAANQAQNVKDEAEKQAQNVKDEANSQSPKSQTDGWATPSKKGKKKQDSRIPSPKKKALDQSQSMKQDGSMVIVEKEPEPKDLNNTLSKKEGGGLF